MCVNRAVLPTCQTNISLSLTRIKITACFLRFLFLSDLHDSSYHKEHSSSPGLLHTLMSSLCTGGSKWPAKGTHSKLEFFVLPLINAFFK